MRLYLLVFVFLVSFKGICQHLHRPVIDLDGNRYQTIVIGKQVWMAENLKVTRFSNGDSIEMIDQVAVWENLETPGYWLLPDYKDKPKIGILYNWYVTSDSRNVCPRGWHIPTDNEWTIMLNFLGGSNVAGKELIKKHHFFSFFSNKNVLKSIFGVYFCGYLGFDGSYCDIDSKSCWWSKTENVSNTAWNRMIQVDDIKIYRDDEIKQAGLSIRCVKN